MPILSLSSAFVFFSLSDTPHIHLTILKFCFLAQHSLPMLHFHISLSFEHMPNKTTCQVAKVQRHTGRHGSSLSILNRWFQHIHVNIVGPPPKSEGQTYLLTIVNHFTRWPEAVPMADSIAASCAQALHNWIAQFGIPDMVTLDRGVQFTGQLWHQLAQHFGFQCNHITSLSPASQWPDWTTHRHLKASLTAQLTTST